MIVSCPDQLPVYTHDNHSPCAFRSSIFRVLLLSRCCGPESTVVQGVRCELAWALSKGSRAFQLLLLVRYNLLVSRISILEKLRASGDTNTLMQACQRCRKSCTLHVMRGRAQRFSRIPRMHQFQCFDLVVLAFIRCLSTSFCTTSGIRISDSNFPCPCQILL